ncbi:MAG: hypothetical protein AAF127_02650 [Pseudomonadota bacterium]
MGFVYVFHGEGASFAAAVYSTVEDAKAAIVTNGMSGTLTAYPLGQTVYAHVVEEGLFKGKDSPEPRYIQRFTSAYLEHFHFVDGVLA